MNRTDQISPFDQGKRAFMFSGGWDNGKILAANCPFPDGEEARQWTAGYKLAEQAWFSKQANRPRVRRGASR